MEFLIKFVFNKYSLFVVCKITNKLVFLCKFSKYINNISISSYANFVMCSLLTLPLKKTVGEEITGSADQKGYAVIHCVVK